MKAITTAAVACSLLMPAQAAVVSPINADQPVQVQVHGDQSPDRWRWRQHYLYDDHHQPKSETVRAGASDARACVEEPARLRRSDGNTVLGRINRCK